MSNLCKNNPLFSKLWAIYKEIFSKQTTPTATNLIFFCLSMLILNACPSVRFAYMHCIRFLTIKKLQAFYYTLGRSEILRDRWWRWIVRQAVQLIPKKLSHIPILISVDDTLVGKHGKFFDFVGIIYDHSSKDKNKYKNGHCFVTLYMSIPIYDDEEKNTYYYLSFPLTHRLWRGSKDDPKITAKEQEAAKIARKLAREVQELTNATTEIDTEASKKNPEQDTADTQAKTENTYKKDVETKLTIARDYISAIIGVLRNEGVTTKVVILCDSWYSKKPILSLRKKDQVETICAVRIDTFMTTVPEDKVNQRGRPRKFGTRIYPIDINTMHIQGTEYSVGSMLVVTKLFDQPVWAFVTEKNGNRRLYLCSDSSLLSDLVPGLKLEGDTAKFVEERPEFLPLALYRNRWDIEKCFYQLKTFWGMRDYRLLSVDGIENLLNLHLLNYSLLTLLPHMHKEFASLASLSIQERRYTCGALLNRLIIIQQLCSDDLKDKKRFSLKQLCRNLILRERLSA